MSTDPLALPSKEILREIARRQDEKQREIADRRKKEAVDERAGAAQLIQRNYRGYRDRRELKGHGISSSMRWTEALKEANYRASTAPKSRQQRGSDPFLASTNSESNGYALATWKRAGLIARRAGNDDTSETDDGRGDGMTGEELEQFRRRKRERKAEREASAKTMGLEYFLEMVDQKHRYGSSLRQYHVVWQQSGTDESFFYWLDFGEGKDVDLEDRPRKRLEEQQVRYLSREERQRYAVEIDKDGLLCWAKNGERITTSLGYKDSVDGIVPADSNMPTWRETIRGVPIPSADDPHDNSDDDSGSVSGLSQGSNEDATTYVNQELHEAKGLQKIKHISAGTVMNDMLQQTTKKNTWIFVADSSFHIYIGIKQSGAFQHSSFLHGGRVAAAGLVRIKRGKVHRLDPLSGHYTPPAKNFRGFVHNLEDAGADMSHVSIGRSYAVLVGLEGYIGAKRSVQRGEQKIKDLIHPEEAKRRQEESKDKSKSAERERAVLAANAREKEELKRQRSFPYSVKKAFGFKKGAVHGSTVSRSSTFSMGSTGTATTPTTAAREEMHSPDD